MSAPTREDFIASFDALTPEVLYQRRGVKWTLYPRTVLPAWVADMDFPVAPAVSRVLRELVDASDVGYPLPPKLGGLARLFVERMESRFGWKISLDQVETLVNVLQGFDIALTQLSEPGEGALLFTPIYPPFIAAVRGCRRRIDECRLARGPERYEIDFDALRAALKPDTRILMLCNPHNPTGRVFERSELEQIAEIAVSNDLFVLADEIHADLVYPGARHTVFASLGPEIASRTITLTSATKAFNLAGLPCAFAVFGSEELHSRFRALPQRMLAHPGIMGVYAAWTAWSEGEPWREAVLEYLDGNRRFLREYLTEQLPGIEHRMPEATFLTWLDCNALELPMSPSRFFLKVAAVGLNDGREFGEAGDGCVRLNIATSRGILEQILERMRDAIERSSGRTTASSPAGAGSRR